MSRKVLTGLAFHLAVGEFHQLHPADLIQAAANLARTLVAALGIKRAAGTLGEVIFLLADGDQLADQAVDLFAFCGRAGGQVEKITKETHARVSSNAGRYGAGNI